ncbi:MAG TPA: extracellular solute-binding protein [Firmicutes bacterium]|jgi:multiple sugar transport system substrate-binding protein|nr:extracellular solute-binding protein [Bacillota bacterium]
MDRPIMLRNVRQKKTTLMHMVIVLLAVALVFPAVSYAKTQLSIMTHTNATFNKWIEEKLEAYCQLNPDVEFHYTIAGNAEMDEKLMVMLAGGAAPDIVNIYYPSNQHLMLNGYFDVAPPFVYEELKKNYIESAWRDMVINGTVYGYPMEITVIAPVIKEDVYDANGVAAPATFDDLLVAQQKLTQLNSDGTYKQLGVNFRSGANSWIMHRWTPLLWGYGADLLDEKGYPAFNNPQGIYATEVLKELSPPGALDFLTGNTATITQGAHFRQSALLADPSLRLKVLPALRGVDGKQVAPIYHWGTVVSKDSPNKEAAWEFLRWLHSPEQIDTLPVVTSSAPTTYSSIRHFQNDAWMMTFIANFDHGRLYPSVPNWAAAEKILITTVHQRVFRGNFSVPEVLRNAEVEVKAALGLL